MAKPLRCAPNSTRAFPWGELRRSVQAGGKARAAAAPQESLSRTEARRARDQWGRLGLWQATAALLDACPSLVAQRRVIDIGCGGCGVAGLAAAVCGAASCILTDFEDLRPMVEENIRNNFGAKSSSPCGAIRFEAYAWESSSSTHSLAPSYETVLCADCMCSAMVEPLLKAIDAVSGPERSSCCLTSGE